jgi:hypothetical protein
VRFTLAPRSFISTTLTGGDRVTLHLALIAKGRSRKNKAIHAESSASAGRPLAHGYPHIQAAIYRTDLATSQSRPRAGIHALAVSLFISPEDAAFMDLGHGITDPGSSSGYAFTEKGLHAATV